MSEILQVSALFRDLRDLHYLLISIDNILLKV